MTGFWILFCFVVALIIYFGKYREEDKKALKARKYRKSGDHNGEYLIPLFDENCNSRREATGADQGDHDNVNKDHSDF